MKLNEYVEERPPRSQQYYNRVYLGLIAGLVLVVFVLFGITLITRPTAGFLMTLQGIAVQP